MNERKRLIALRGTDDMDESTGETVEFADHETAHEEAPAEAYQESWEEEEEEPLARRNAAALLPALAIVSIAAWTGFFAWANLADMQAGASAQSWIGWISDWAVPVVLIIGVWLLAMRNSRREAQRFGETARLLSQESASLEHRLVVVNRELSLARDFIASQSRDLESLGRVAGDRLSEHAERLQGLIRDNGAQVDAIGSVSDTAVRNMDRLRDQLPVVSNAARDVASQIGNAGNTAHDKLEQLVVGFDRLDEFGEVTDRRVEGLNQKIEAMIAAFGAQLDTIENVSGARFASLRDQSEAFRHELDGRETDALAGMRRRAEALDAELADFARDADSREAESIETMRVRLAELREEGVRLSTEMTDGQREAETLWLRMIEQMRENLTNAVREVSEIDEAAIGNARRRLATLSTTAQEVDQRINDSASAFEAEFDRRRQLYTAQEQDALAGLQDRLADFDRQIAEREERHIEHLGALAARGEEVGRRLQQLDEVMVHLIEQGGGESDKLGLAGDRLAERLSQSRAILEESNGFVSRLTDDSVRLLEIIRASSEHSEGALSASIENAESRLDKIRHDAEDLRRLVGEAEEKGSNLVAHIGTATTNSEAARETLSGLEERLSALAAQSEVLAARQREDLEEAIAALEDASRQALVRLREEQNEAIREIGERIGAEGTSAIEKALKEGSIEAIAELEEAARIAGERGRDTTVQLRDQLAKVNELASNLEQRVSQARAGAEEQVDSNFARRMALIVESLNSSAIDISKAFDTEVTDTAWSGYLRGDRGIFTRRSVRLLDNRDVRAINAIYADDAEFRETVNRYIHDFEAMLRSVLSTRDGNSLGITLLSSDMGKLYVALAQAIERLRG